MSLTGKSPSETYKDITYVGGGNTGVTSTVKKLFTGEGSSTSLSISDRALQVKSATDNTTALSIQNASGSSKFLVDTTNDAVKALGVHVNTQYKEFGLYDFSPTAGYHYGMISSNVMESSGGADFASTTAWGNGADPATSLEIHSAHVSVALDGFPSYWYLMDSISIDQIRVLARCDSSENLNFHVYSYDLDTSTNHGNLSGGTLIAHINSVMAATNLAIKTDTLVIDSDTVAANKILVAFVENEDGTGDISCQLNIKYHITG